MKQIFSTLAADTRYTGWNKNAGLNTPGHSVLVKGGAGIALRGSGQMVNTPQGVRTEVSDEDAQFLSENPHFQDHLKRGFVVIKNTAQDPDKAAQSMDKDTGSAPKTPADVAADAKKGDKDDVPLQAVTNKGK